MRHSRPSRIPVAIAMSLVIGGCALGGPGAKTPKHTGPVPLATKLKTVDTMTKTFSLASNDGLAKVTTALTKNDGLIKAMASLQSVAASLSGMGGSSVVASGGGNVVASGAGNLTTTTHAGVTAAYQLASVIASNGATLEYDDTTKELTGVKTADAELAFQFKNDGRTRSWQATIVRSKDGTTGSFYIEATGDWAPIPTPAPVQPMPLCDAAGVPFGGPFPSLPPSAAPADGNADMVAPSPSPTAVNAYGLAQAQDFGNGTGCSPDPAWTPEPPPSPPPFKVFGGEYPKTVEALKIKVDLVPQGDSKLALSMEGAFDDPQQLPAGYGPSGLKVPLHWAFKLAVPKVSFDWDSHATVNPGHSTFKAVGSLSADGNDGTQRFTYELVAAEADKTGHFWLTNDDAKIRFAVDAAPDANGIPQPKSHLVSTEDGTELGTVALDPTRPRFAIITLKDGTKKDWELFPESLFPQPTFAPPPTSDNFPPPEGFPGREQPIPATAAKS